MKKKTPAAQSASKMKSFYAIVGVVLLGGVATLAYVSRSGGPTVITLPPDLPEGTAGGYVMGSPSARVEIVEFGDFECPGCGYFATLTEPDIRKHLVEPGIARFRYVDYPLVDKHPHALSAHVAAACADEQGKFWEMHDAIFAGQNQWNTQATDNPKKILKGYASDIRIDVKTWEECFDQSRPLPRIMANREEGSKLGVNGTPTFRIGNKLISLVEGKSTFDQLKAHVDSAIAADTAKANPGGEGRQR